MDLIKKEADELVEAGMPLGFEDEDTGDMIIPRVKVIQTLSPERKDKTADEGDIINSLTKERLNGKVFIPVFKFNNNVLWKDRADGGGILCIAKDGRTGTNLSTDISQACAMCRKCEFNNNKVGKEAVPTCTKYINFFGFFAGERAPIILSFSKTCYNEGKKLYSLAKVSMQNMWNYGYTLSEKMLAKGNNEWYIPVVTPAGPSGEEDRKYAYALFTTYRNSMRDVAYDMDDATSTADTTPVMDGATEF